MSVGAWLPYALGTSLCEAVVRLSYCCKSSHMHMHMLHAHAHVARGTWHVARGTRHACLPAEDEHSGRAAPLWHETRAMLVARARWRALRL